MDAVTWERAKDLITDVLKRTPAEREAFLREQCPDPKLREEIVAMLRAYEKDPDFLEQPPTVDEGVDEFADLQPGTRVGPYVIIDRLGRGGMGQTPPWRVLSGRGPTGTPAARHGGCCRPWKPRKSPLRPGRCCARSS